MSINFTNVYYDLSLLGCRHLIIFTMIVLLPFVLGVLGLEVGCHQTLIFLLVFSTPLQMNSAGNYNS